MYVLKDSPSRRRWGDIPYHSPEKSQASEGEFATHTGTNLERQGNFHFFESISKPYDNMDSGI